ncbi:guanyl-specific ribonuclease N1 [Colletotrichum truncatum]|uniref:Guanyl-specific ribonuclease N1 n=1 Tax=Colletotrichum truncatum TaxID=5467 RepID=A0ACC3YSN9_COLTU|nr:guanyl-specific ribonuclease N1 [Colletotrichum truncatum]KAF6782132.1 guanyl-specific ribonuclease N1 [Colletotrichum truncatum]
MVSFKSTLVLGLCAVLTAANPIALDKRQGTNSIESVTCGTTKYSRKQLNEATAEGCRLYAANQQLGTSQYPHRFNNREGLVFATSGPYQEFPILSSGNYTGRAPGADRVVFNPSYQGSCVYVGAMTHTGAAERNGFLACNATNSKSSGSDGKSAASGLTVSGPVSYILPVLSLLAIAA